LMLDAEPSSSSQLPTALSYARSGRGVK